MKVRHLAALLAVVLVPAAASAQDQAQPRKPRVAVMEIRAIGTEATRAELLSEVALTEAAGIPGYEVIGKSDISAMIGFEKQKAIVGCTDDFSCLAEVGGALGVDFILVGSLGKMGALYRIDVKLVEVKKAKVKGRVGLTVDGQEEKLVAAIQQAVRELLGAAGAAGKDAIVLKPQPKGTLDLTPAPPAEVKPRGMGWTAFGAGVVAIGLGGFAVYEGLAAKGKYDDAGALLTPSGAVKVTATADGYRTIVADGDAAKQAAFISGGAAVGCAVLSGVLGYISYKRTGEIGPFRF
jgi:TolB-like protein